MARIEYVQRHAPPLDSPLNRIPESFKGTVVHFEEGAGGAYRVCDSPPVQGLSVYLKDIEVSHAFTS